MAEGDIFFRGGVAFREGNDAGEARIAEGSAEDLGLGGAPESHSHSASDITSGVLATARLGSGSPAAGSYVDGGTGSWTALSAAPAVEVFAHGANANAIRPVTASIVIWVGTVQPNNWIDDDMYINATTV